MAPARTAGSVQRELTAPTDHQQVEQALPMTGRHLLCLVKGGKLPLQKPLTMLPTDSARFLRNLCTELVA